jgi:hypothetical protein
MTVTAKTNSQKNLIVKKAFRVQYLITRINFARFEEIKTGFLWKRDSFWY